MSEYHIPVLVTEVMAALDVQPRQWYVDATVGGGGHAAEILKRGGNVLGLDQDAEAIAEAGQRFEGVKRQADDESKSYLLIKSNFRDLTEVVRRAGIGPAAGVLFDLGVSSHQLDDIERGFSFQSPNLDMRMDQSFGADAEQLVNVLPEADLATLIFDLGEERYAKRFARAIVQSRAREALKSGRVLAEVIERASPPEYRRGRIHPATRTFQALRLAVNDELDSLRQALPQAVDVLLPGGHLAVISFHSLEDRIVKHFFASEPQLVVPSKEPIVATSSEVEANPRARSAKLRVAGRV